MNRRKQLPLGGWLIVVLIALGHIVLRLQPSTSLLWHGVITQGVIAGVKTVSCGSRREGQGFSARFTDQTGQAHTSTFRSCDYGEPINTSPGSSITIVYLPDDPTTIARSGGLLFSVWTRLIFTILFGLLTLILLPLWIRKQIRKASLQRQEKQAAAERWRAMEEHLANPNGAHQD